MCLCLSICSQESWKLNKDKTWNFRVSLWTKNGTQQMVPALPFIQWVFTELLCIRHCSRSWVDDRKWNAFSIQVGLPNYQSFNSWLNSPLVNKLSRPQLSYTLLSPHHVLTLSPHPNSSILFSFSLLFPLFLFSFSSSSSVSFSLPYSSSSCSFPASSSSPPLPFFPPSASSSQPLPPSNICCNLLTWSFYSANRFLSIVFPAKFLAHRKVPSISRYTLSVCEWMNQWMKKLELPVKCLDCCHLSLRLERGPIWWSGSGPPYCNNTVATSLRFALPRKKVLSSFRQWLQRHEFTLRGKTGNSWPLWAENWHFMRTLAAHLGR